jgi:hypothetical protein
MTMLFEKVNVKVNGLPEQPPLDNRYLASRRRTPIIATFGNVLVNIHVREDDAGLIDRYAILHTDVCEASDEARSDLLAAYDWAVWQLTEMSKVDECSKPDRRSRR